MKLDFKAALVAAAIFSTSVSFDTEAHEYTWSVSRVIDGDTFEVANEPIAGLGNIKVRLYGIDAPELHGKCDKEKTLALRATALADTILRSPAKVTPVSWDKYGGRIVGKVTVNGKDVATSLIESGFAVPYFGTGLKKNWCV